DLAKTPVHFKADSLTHDDTAQTVTAIGHVELVQGQQILRADKMVYYLAEDKVTAIGDVSFLDAKGDVHFAQYAELHDRLKDGFIQGLLSLLADGSRFTAAEAKREDGGTKLVMTDATYTACKVCENNPHPLWQIRASQITDDTQDKMVYYKNARLDFEGVPVFWSPVFSHPDPTEKQKSGFLHPEYGWSNEVGTHMQLGYYYAIGTDKDATFQVEPTSLAGTVFKGQYRERFDNGELSIDANTVNSNRSDVDGTIVPNRQRASIFADGRFDLNDEWRTGFDLQRASDQQYLNFYDLYNGNYQSQEGIRNSGVLTSDVYAERFAGRDYALISAMGFQDLRLDTGTTQPDILPMAEDSMLGEPNALWGGRWSMDSEALELRQNANQQNEQRGSVDLGWQRHGTSALGFSNTVSLDGRADVYGVQNLSTALPGQNDNPDTVRGMATASFVSSYPLVRALHDAQAVVEPVAGINLSPDLPSSTYGTIPNVDSADVQLDADNLFQANRYPGIDREEDGGRVNYGVRGGLYADDGKYGKAFVGESYRLYGNPLYPYGSGLENRRSDVVGQFQLGLSKYLFADYRVLLDSSSFAARRHEIQAGGGNDRFKLNVRYFFLKPVDGLAPAPPATSGADFADTRQEIEIDQTYTITKTWKFHTAGLYDMGNQPGLRNASAGIDYSDECFTFGIEGAREIATAASGINDTRIMLEIGFKGLGEFSPGIGLHRTQNTAP
ncbi:MAG: LPS assembly protein LptD, partial [Alphaproteobacteria bacterium]|nr:LPS assembly protein LptD [Alphaproteobacteria bacterium]